MQDPAPENISGSKIETHEFVHHVQWGQVVLGLAAIVVVYAVFLRSSGAERRERS